MRSFVGRLAFAVGLVALAPPGGAEEPSPPQVRQGIEALEAQLDRAVDRVSLPHAARLLGRSESARGYRLPGYGVVLVLTPRALPGGAGRVYYVGPHAPMARKRVRVETPPGSSAVAWVDVPEEEGVETFERQVLVLQHETEAARRAAEEEMERIVHDVRIRVAPPARVPGEPTPVPEPAPAPEAPQAVVPPAPPAPPTPAAAPRTPLPPEPPAAPPWKFWFEAGTPSETRPPETVIADVRASLVEALVGPGDVATGLRPDERVTVAVDFVPGGLFAANARPGRTLVVSVRARDLQARARGSIALDELRRRVEVSEY